MNILVPGGASYIGALLVPQLLADGHYVTVYDTLLFGDGWLPKDNGHLEIIKADVRNIHSWLDAVDGQDAVIYMASISRELLCQQNEALAQEINVDSFTPAIEAARRSGVQRFIYASSVAVYGSSNHDASEEEPLNPTTIYGRGKAACEKIMWQYQTDYFCCASVRSASVCGYSPRQRLDLTVNRMVHDAYRKGAITVEGGAQKRSHVHIRDLCDFYKLMLSKRTDLIRGQAFNVVQQNQTVLETATTVAREMGGLGKIEISMRPSVDNRSYSVDGSKAQEMLDFVPHRPIAEAVRDLKVRFEGGYWPDSTTNPIYQNMVTSGL